MGEKRAYRPRKPGGGRKKLKPEYDAGKNLKEQMDAAVTLYEEDCSLQSIADALALNPIKVRKLLITAGVYESEVAEKVQDTFEEYRETQNYKEAIFSTANTLQLSKASVTSYLPYEKGVYFPSTADKEKISVGAERQRRYRAVRKLRTEPTEEHLWEVVLLYNGVRFKTYSGLPFTYEIRKGRNGQYTKELWIDRRENSKSLAWSSVLLALGNIKQVGEVVERPKGSKGLYRSLGSIDVVAAARSVLQVERDTENPDIRIVHQIKNSLAPTAEDIRFSISADKGFRWLECRPQFFGKQQLDTEPKFDTEQQKAVYWIKHFLEKGDMSANEIYCRLDNEGVSKRVARMVKTEMGIHCYQKKRRWYWSVQLEEGAMNGPQV